MCAGPAAVVCHAFTLVSKGFEMTHQAATKGRMPGCNRANAEQELQNNEASVIQFDADRKAFCTLAAKLALKGYSVFELTDGTFIASKWNLIKPLADPRALAVFARQIGCAA